MLRNSVDWMGNRVDLEEIDGTGLTVLQWYRPWNGALRGARVLADDEVRQLTAAVELAEAGTREHPRLDGVAGRPLDLGAFLTEVLGEDGDGQDGEDTAA